MYQNFLNNHRDGSVKAVTPRSILPAPFEWCGIPAGKVEIEGHGIFDVATFQIAKYPITNAQFAVFERDPNGYANPQWWDFSQAARKWRAENPKPLPTIRGRNYPRINVTWYTALAFCRWFSHKAREVAITLPTEQQWQRAAIGDTGWMYPWGNQFDIRRCNTNESRHGNTTPVTRYRNGASPYGVMDMCGNVWEWTLTEYTTASSEGVDNCEWYSQRGGSWLADQEYACATYRGYERPDFKLLFMGFRVVRF